MTVKEFSDSFDTLLNSYASKAIFGDQAGDTEIVLDEYEKSVLLTQAQDNVIKSYFEKHTNQLGQGFDDSSRRQVDFSSLIKTATLHTAGEGEPFDDRGIIYKLPVCLAPDGHEYSRVLYILNEALLGYTGSSTATFVLGEGYGPEQIMRLTFKNKSENILQIETTGSTEAIAASATVTPGSGSSYDTLSITYGVGASGDDIITKVGQALTSATGWSSSDIEVTYVGSPNFNTNHTQGRTLMPKSYSSNQDNQTRYVIIPINYKEYDREMSKAYANPLKKQAWRLFQNIADGFDIYSELIPIWNVDTTDLVYKIRYIERPTPIVLVDLPPGLSIDGYNETKGCNLNPIIHPEILHEAVRLAIESRASAVARAEAYQEAARRQPNT